MRWNFFMAAVVVVSFASPFSSSLQGQLPLAEFEKLHRELQAPQELWQSIPWKLSVLEAQAEAVKEKKPVYMLVRSGHPLGCV